MEAAGYARFEIGRPFGFLLGNEVFLFARMKRLIVQSDISIRGGSCVEQHRTAALQHCSTAADWSIVKELWADLEIVALMNGFNLGNDLRSLVRGVSSLWQLSLKNWLYIDKITTNRSDFGSFNVKREFYGGCAFCYCHNSASGWFSHIYSIISIVKTFKVEIVTPLSLLQRNTQSPQRESAAGV